jgi:hypothetical protein
MAFLLIIIGNYNFWIDAKKHMFGCHNCSLHPSFLHLFLHSLHLREFLQWFFLRNWFEIKKWCLIEDIFKILRFDGFGFFALNFSSQRTLTINFNLIISNQFNCFILFLPSSRWHSWEIYCAHVSSPLWNHWRAKQKKKNLKGKHAINFIKEKQPQQQRINHQDEEKNSSHIPMIIRQFWFNQEKEKIIFIWPCDGAVW